MTRLRRAIRASIREYRRPVRGWSESQFFVAAGGGGGSAGTGTYHGGGGGATEWRGLS